MVGGIVPGMGVPQDGAGSLEGIGQQCQHSQIVFMLNSSPQSRMR